MEGCGVSAISYLDLVEDFHKAFAYRYPTPEAPSFDAECCSLRVRLLREEITGPGELWESITKEDRHGILDGLCDFQYVLSGAVLALGLRSIFESVLPIVTEKGFYVNSPILFVQLKVNQIAAAIDRLEHMLACAQIPASVECLVRIQLTLVSLIKSLEFERVFDAAFISVHESNMAKLWSEEEVIEWCKFPAETLKFDRSGELFIARRKDGKIRKPPSHKPVDLSAYL